MHAVNLYANQLNIRIIVVDVVPVKGHNLTLEQFLEWRKEETGLVGSVYFRHFEKLFRLPMMSQYLFDIDSKEVLPMSTEFVSGLPWEFAGLV